jgi:hypothetical protein
VALLLLWKAREEPNSRLGAAEAPRESRWIALPPGERPTGAASSRMLERLE